MKKIILFFVVFFYGAASYSQVKVVATTTVIYDLVKQVGGDKISVDYLCRGGQDPHFLEVLPSYMLKIRKADIMFEIGLGLELWAPQLIDGSRNSNL
ncbi:MAG TPA: metal ABC transporter substrate-binding protein, partial [Ignavibacteriaceae bacterium]|nr:metal ABC transporter substrate-binding protein [Ignavibacteriaceae bacterium]